MRIRLNFTEVIFFLFISALIVAAFFALRPGELIPPGSSGPDLSVPNNSNKNPPPQVSPTQTESAGLNPGGDYPVPPVFAGTVEIYPPPSNQTPLPAYSVTPRPTNTVPPGWPVYDPNAPTDTPLPVVTPSIEPFPTRNFQVLPEDTKEDGLFGFWYPYREGMNADVVLEKIALNSKGQRTEKPNQSMVVETLSRRSEHPRLGFLLPSPDRDYFFLQTSNRGGALFEILNVARNQSILDQYTEIYGYLIQFMDWSPDGTSFIAEFDSGTDNRGFASVIPIDNPSEANQIILEKPELEGIRISAAELKYSSDGSQIAGIITYPPTSEKNNPWLLEVYIWKGKDFTERKVLCSVEQGKDAAMNTLKWSFDNKRLLWVGGLDTQEEDESEQWLWVADLANGDCKPVYKLGLPHSLAGWWIPGEFDANWSLNEPEEVLVHLKENLSDGGARYRIALLNLDTLDIRVLVESRSILSNAQFSPDGQLVVFTQSYEYYGEIWAVDLIGGKPFPIAGPTTIYAPFVWDRID